MRNLSKETDSQSPLAAEPWLTTLVEAIKKEDHAVAEREYQAVRRAELIAQNGPVFWRKFTDVLEVLFRQMEDLFGDHVTKGKITFTRSPYGGGITINKSAYPFVSFSATPNYSETTAHFTYTVVNPEIPQNIGVPGRFLPCRFGVESDQVVMSLDGTMFPTPEAAAKFIIEKLFTIPSSAPAILHEPEPATIPEPNPMSEYAWPRLRSKAAFPVFDEAPVTAAETPVEAETAAPVADPVVADPVVVAAEEVAPGSVAPVVEPEPAPVPAPVALLPPPLPFSAVPAPAPRAPFSKLFASASRLLGGGSAASSKNLMTALSAPLPQAVEPPKPIVEETLPVENVAVEAALPEAAEPVAVTEPEVVVETVEPVEPVLAAEEVATLSVEEPLETSECEDSPTAESESTPHLVAISTPRTQRRRVRPQVVRTRFRYQDPRRHLPVQPVPAPVAARPAQVRHAAAGF
jgi:hypothetical protein